MLQYKLQRICNPLGRFTNRLQIRWSELERIFGQQIANPLERIGASLLIRWSEVFFTICL